jgi:hypothetical protein
MADSSDINYAGIGTAVGGLLGFVGVFLKWFSYSYPLLGGTVTIQMNGSEDWTGRVAIIAGVTAFAFGCAYVILSDPGIRKVCLGFMGIGAIFTLAASIIGLFRATQAVGVPFLPGATGNVPVAIGLAGGVYLSVAGGVVAVAATVIALQRQSRATA